MGVTRQQQKRQQRHMLKLMSWKSCCPSSHSSWQENILKDYLAERTSAVAANLERHSIPTAFNHIFALSLNHMWDVKSLIYRTYSANLEY